MGVVSSKSIEVDGVHYTTSTFPAGEGIDLLHRFCRLIDENEVAAAFLGTEDGPGLLAELDKLAALLPDEDGEDTQEVTAEELGEYLSAASGVARMVFGCARRAELGEVSAFMRALLMRTETDELKVGDLAPSDGGPRGKGNVGEHFDSHFQGRFLHLLKVVWWVARLSFGLP